MMGGTIEPQKAGEQGLPHRSCALLAAASGFLVWMSFPPIDFGAAAWLALAPLMLLAVEARTWRAALWTLPAATGMFIALLHWLRFVTTAGWIALSIYCALYWVLFVVLLSWCRKRKIPLLPAAPVLFTALEFTRATVLTGFPFLLLAHTQHKYLPVIQMSDLFGTYGITFVMASISCGVAQYIHARRRLLRERLLALSFALVLLIMAMCYGVGKVQSLALKPGPIVSMVQGNIPQDLKHSVSHDDLVDLLDKHVRLTESLSEKTDLVIWAETMFPVPLNIAFDQRTVLNMLASKDADISDYGKFATQGRADLLKAARAADAPILVGSETYSMDTGQNWNSAYLVTPDGRILGQYDKISLVVFGEYTPLATTFPFLRKLRPAVMGPDLSSGRLPTLFQAPANGGFLPEFGVTICYEDAEADLFRTFVKNGARFMVNITNDGWFRNSTELDEHLAVCVFRAVETRVPIARCTNTGITAIISPKGEITHRLKDSIGRDRDIAGTLTGKLMMADTSTLYTRIGDAFAWASLGGSGLLLLYGLLNRRNKSER